MRRRVVLPTKWCALSAITLTRQTGPFVVVTGFMLIYRDYVRSCPSNGQKTSSHSVIISKYRSHSQLVRE